VRTDYGRCAPRRGLSWRRVRNSYLLGEGRLKPIYFMSITAFIVKVPEAEHVVGELRDRFDATARLAAPAHITVLFPFMSPGEITSVVIHLAQAAVDTVSSFVFSLEEIGRFPATTYLSPDPPDPFVSLTKALIQRFPMFLPYGGAHEGIVPHLTVAHGDALNARAVELELERRLRLCRPIRATCNAVTLIENSSGLWKEMHVFDLRAARRDVAPA